MRHYLPGLKEKGVDRVLCVINGKPSSCTLLADLIGLPMRLSCCRMRLARPVAFGVGRGWLPDQDKVEIFGTDAGLAVCQAFGMLLGLGAGNTLPSVITDISVIRGVNG